jgi:hypothetical protein
MKKLLTLLLEPDSDTKPPTGRGGWWWIHEATGDAPAHERTSMFTYPEVLRVVRNRLTRLGASHAATIPPAADTLPPRSDGGAPTAGQP